MPTLPGSLLTDNSGVQLTDEDAVELGENDIDVVIMGGILTDARTRPTTLSAFIDAAQLAAEIIDRWIEHQAWLDLIAKIDSLQTGTTSLLTRETAEQGRWTTHWSRLDVLDTAHASILAAIAEIEPGGGGLTQEEHDHLLALINADTEQIAADVWGWNYNFNDMMGYDEGPAMYTMIDHIATWVQWQAGYHGFPVPDRPHFAYLTKASYSGGRWLGYWTNQAATTQVPILDLSLVQDGDTVWSFLTREYPAYAWTKAGPGSWPEGGAVYLVQQANVAYFRCTLTDADLRSNPVTVETTVVNTTVDVTTAPLWPGAANVLLGTTVPLADQLVVTEPMHGVIVTVTTPPSKTGLRMVGGRHYDYSVGELTFGTDEGDLEPWQYLGFRQAIFTCKSMEQAASAHFRVLAGAEGTVTPWLKALPG